MASPQETLLLLHRGTLRSYRSIILPAVVVNAKHHNPSILNPDFLKYNEIVDAAWPLSENERPICVEPFSRVTFENGVRITAERERVVFFETLAESSRPRIPEIARKYVETLPHVQYEAVGINPAGDIQVGTAPESPFSFISQVFLEFRGHHT